MKTKEMVMLNFKDENERIVARGPVSKYALGLDNFPKSFRTSGIRKHFGDNRPQEYRLDAHPDNIHPDYRFHLAGKLRDFQARGQDMHQAEHKSYLPGNTGGDSE